VGNQFFGALSSIVFLFASVEHLSKELDFEQSCYAHQPGPFYRFWLVVRRRMRRWRLSCWSCERSTKLVF
jgi:hypothetical protein